MTAQVKESKGTEEDDPNDPPIPSTNGTVRLIFYDFDQTITTAHLYRELHGGRLKSLVKLSDDKLVALFGGKQRISFLDDHFNILHSAGIELAILSFGWKEVIEGALERVDLGSYFQCRLIFGRDSKELVRFNKHKGKVIAHLMAKRELQFDQVLFVEDSASNIAQSKAICKTLHIEDRCGMTKDHMLEIENQIHFNAHSESELNELNKKSLSSKESPGKKMKKTKRNNDCFVTPCNYSNGDSNRSKKSKSRSKLEKYKIQKVPKWFDALNQDDDEAPIIEIQDIEQIEPMSNGSGPDTEHNDVEIAADFTFGLGVDDKGMNLNL